MMKSMLPTDHQITGAVSTDKELCDQKGRISGSQITPRRLSFFVLLSLLSLSFVYLKYSEVDNSITQYDREFIPFFLKGLPSLPVDASFDEEINYIKEVQKSVLNVASTHAPIPFDTDREPRDLYLSKAGVCFDRSRTIEKILRYSGFKTRHISFYSTKSTHSAIQSLLTPNIPSHAVSEVLTQRGWVVVGSNHSWLALSSDNSPISIKQIQAAASGGEAIDWKEAPPSFIYVEPFTYVYGLYSRHGHFYPPYNAVPDINYPEFIQNIYDWFN